MAQMKLGLPEFKWPWEQSVEEHVAAAGVIPVGGVVAGVTKAATKVAIPLAIGGGGVLLGMLLGGGGKQEQEQDVAQVQDIKPMITPTQLLDILKEQRQFQETTQVQDTTADITTTITPDIGIDAGRDVSYYSYTGVAPSVAPQQIAIPKQEAAQITVIPQTTVSQVAAGQEAEQKQEATQMDMGWIAIAAMGIMAFMMLRKEDK